MIDNNSHEKIYLKSMSLQVIAKFNWKIEQRKTANRTLNYKGDLGEKIKVFDLIQTSSFFPTNNTSQFTKKI